MLLHPSPDRVKGSSALHRIDTRFCHENCIFHSLRIPLWVQNRIFRRLRSLLLSGRLLLLPFGLRFQLVFVIWVWQTDPLPLYIYIERLQG